jgi:hypothetical protein
MKANFTPAIFPPSMEGGVDRYKFKSKQKIKK